MTGEKRDLGMHQASCGVNLTWLTLIDVYRPLVYFFKTGASRLITGSHGVRNPEFFQILQTVLFLRVWHQEALEEPLCDLQGPMPHGVRYMRI